MADKKNQLPALTTRTTGMSDDEILIMIISGVAAVVGAALTRVSRFPSLYTRNNPGIGLMRLTVAASVVWTAFVIQYYGDPSIQGVYVFFYLLMAYGVTKIFGQVITVIFGIRLRTDVYERKNLAAAIFVSGFILGTGIIFGGSLWGEADPLSDAEGGWWIPLGFFFMGWFCLVLATAVCLWLEPGSFRRQVCQELDVSLAWSTAIYVVSTASLLFRGVAGDFWGWRHGILGMGTIAVMLAGHGIIALIAGTVPPSVWLRLIERALYIGLAATAWAINQAIDLKYIGG